MSWTKKQLILAALEEIGQGDSEFEATPAELESGLNRLDGMMAEWDRRGIKIGFPLSYTKGESDINGLSNVPTGTNEAVITNLAIRLAPSYGKVPSRETKVTAKNSLNAVLSGTGITTPPLRGLPAGVPLGAGNKTWRTGGRDNPFSAGQPAQDIDPLSDYYLG